MSLDNSIDCVSHLIISHLQLACSDFLVLIGLLMVYEMIIKQRNELMLCLCMFENA